MAPEVGFEPTTNRLTADRSTTELLRSVVGQDTSRGTSRFKRKLSIAAKTGKRLEKVAPTPGLQPAFTTECFTSGRVLFFEDQGPRAGDAFGKLRGKTPRVVVLAKAFLKVPG